MKFSYNWIREFVPGLDVDPQSLERLITMKTAECDGIEVAGELPVSGDAGARRVGEGGGYFEPRPRDGKPGKTGRDKLGHKSGFKKGRRGRMN